MSRIPVVLVAALALALAAPAASGAAVPKAGTCWPSGTRTVDAGIGGRIFYRPTSDADRVYLCSYRSGRRTQIGWDVLFDAEEVELTRFARRFVAIATVNSNPGGSFSSIFIRRVRDGRRLARLAAAPDAPAVGAGGSPIRTGVRDLVIRGDGRVAWIVEVRDEGTGASVYELRTAAPGAASILLAAGADIAPGSLALAGSTLYWSQAGLPRSAPLP